MLFSSVVLLDAWLPGLCSFLEQRALQRREREEALRTELVRRGHTEESAGARAVPPPR